MDWRTQYFEEPEKTGISATWREKEGHVTYMYTAAVPGGDHLHLSIDEDRIDPP